MEIVSIEKKTFEEMAARFDRFVRRMDDICKRHGEKTMNEWMDNQDVCRMLNISPRTLQTLRDAVSLQLHPFLLFSQAIGKLLLVPILIIHGRYLQRKITIGIVHGYLL